jgi:acetyltransferase-like isoleucine patch superfamily enzyme
MAVMTQNTSIRYRIKHSNAWWAKAIKRAVRSWHYGQFPCIRWLHRPLLWLHCSVMNAFRQAGQKLYFAPLFKSRLQQPPRRLQLYSGMPQVLGHLDLSIGEGCRISGVSSFFGRSASQQMPVCQIGNNVDIGWQCSISVGRQVRIGDNVRLAGRCYLAGFPGHPEDPVDRAQGLPETDEQVGDIILESNVWLATGVTVLAGVTIGENSIIAAGSVVTRDIPANVVAAGIPAKVLRPIKQNNARGEHDA